MVLPRLLFFLMRFSPLLLQLLFQHSSAGVGLGLWDLQVCHKKNNYLIGECYADCYADVMLKRKKTTTWDRLTFTASIFFLLSSASSVDSWLSEPSLSYCKNKRLRGLKRQGEADGERRPTEGERTFSPLSRALICCRSLKFCRRICLSLDRYS